MKALLLTAALLVAAPALSAAPKTYQVTGPVLEVHEESFVVQKGSEKWELGRGPDTKVTGELKPGAQVTVQYRMAATSVTVKGDKGAGAKPAKAKK